MIHVGVLDKCETFSIGYIRKRNKAVIHKGYEFSACKSGRLEVNKKIFNFSIQKSLLNFLMFFN